MANSVFIASIAGPICLAIGLGIIFNLKNYKEVIGDFFRNAGLIYLGGVFSLLIGLLIVLVHNKWAANWSVIITILGWLSLIKGLWLIILPGTLSKMVSAYAKKTNFLVIHCLVILALGIYLTIMAYFVA
jgi:hypothetical protein